MRGDYEAKNDRHPFSVQYVGLDELCVRNLTTDEIVLRETKAHGDAAKSQWDRLDAKAFELAKQGRNAVLAKPLESRPHASDGAPRETLEESLARLNRPTRTCLLAGIIAVH